LFSAVAERRDLDAARAIYYELLPLLQLMEGRGKYTQFVKAACRLMGHDVGAPRSPLQEPTAAEMEVLQSVLEPWRNR
jgi:4-hydroxy-tetrahydrodipicolinate synthase